MKQFKHKFWTITTFRISLLSLVMVFTQSVFAGDLKIGSAAVKITPPLGTPLAGYYSDRGAVGVHDELYAKAIVIEKDGSKIALVSCDLISVTTDIVTKVRNIVGKTVGISPDNVMVSATHSHTGPVIPKKNDRTIITGKTAEVHKKYISDLPTLIAESVKLANSALVPARASIAIGREESISFNRRFFMTDGTVGWNPGKLNPKIIKPAGPIDPEVFVFYAETQESKPISTYVNFAVHLDNVGGSEISADMPFTLSTILGKIKGNDMVTLYAQGCCGNINHINVKNKEPQKGNNEAQRIGTVLSGEVIKVYTRLQPVEIATISTKREIVKLPLPEVKPDELLIARDIISRDGKADAPKFLELVNAYKVLDVLDRKGEPLDAEVQVIALGDQCAIVGLPGEIFTELGMYIKSRSPYTNTMVIELANGSIGYVPDRKAYAEGNYEPVSARCGAGSGEILAEKAVQLLYELKMK
ncbi:MAG: neutral/alkaline non-lysosomal ceramidase N-terminal domain-containing protein [Bacteroidales bacterium]|nr:neutral/alkaline non-lysosomal ceramidase N-terminal domain-containing protein [Bacteroidales bacterium]